MKTTSWRRAGAGALAFALAFGVTACGDDDDAGDDASDVDDGSGTSAPSEPAAFCESFFEFQDALFATPEDETADAYFEETVLPLVDAMAEDASIADDAATVRTELEKGAESAFASFEGGALGQAVSGLQSSAADDCGYERIDVDAVDYGFEGLPPELEPGKYAIVLTNTSDSELHEIGLMTPKDPAQSLDEVLALPDDSDAVEEIGGAFAPPGATGVAFVELEEGPLYYACFIPVGSGEGAEDGTPHFQEGMKGESEVSAA